MQGNILGQSAGLNIHGMIEEYVVASGGKVNAGDFVKFISNFDKPTLLTVSNEAVRRCVPVMLDQDTVFVAFSYTDSDYIAGMVCKFNDHNEITTGTITQFSSISNITFGGIVATKLNNETVMLFCSWGNARYYLYGFVCKIDGMDISANSFDCLPTSRVDYEAMHLCLMTLEENKVLLTYYHDRKATYGIIYEMDNFTNAIMRGTPVILTTKGMTKTLNFNSVKFLNVAEGEHSLYATLGDIEGENITITMEEINLELETKKITLAPVMCSIDDMIALNEYTALALFHSNTKSRILNVNKI